MGWRIDTYPQLSRLAQHQLASFPDHRDYLERRFAGSDATQLAFDDCVADYILRIGEGEIERICDDYRWLCGEVLNEELNFRRTGAYRLSSFEQAFKEVYSNTEYMSRYMNGLLASQIWWQNHTEVLRFFRDTFIAGNPDPFDHLEVGPGHGLFLHLAAQSPKCRLATGWDISEASLAGARATVDMLGTGAKVELANVNLFSAPATSFASIAFSEVLEHLEQPLDALRILHGLLAAGGRIFINAPVNSPAPDHIFLFSTPEQIVELVQQAGFTVIDTLFAPATGANLERARKRKLSISTAIIGTR